MYAVFPGGGGLELEQFELIFCTDMFVYIFYKPDKVIMKY